MAAVKTIGGWPVSWHVTLAAVALVGVWWFTRKGNAQAAGAAVGAAAVNAGAGVVLGVGDALGVPRTDQTECERALAEGRYWDASFACPAGDFIGGLWQGATGPDNTGSVSGSW